MKDSTNLAWAAGFFDGEGCFHTSKPYKKKPNSKPRLHIAAIITQIHPEVLDRFCEILGVGSVRGPYQRGGDRSNIWRYQTQRPAEVKYIYEMLYPWLGSIKRAQGKEALGRYDEWASSREQGI